MKRILVAAAALTLLSTGSSFATPITRQIDFSFTGYVQVGGGSPVPPPVDPVTGSFTITFDPTQAYTNQTTGILQNSLNLTSSTALAFTYLVPQDILTIGGIGGGGAQGTAPNTFDFSIRFDHFTTAPVIGSAGYTQGGPVYVAGTSAAGTNKIGNLSFTLNVKDPTVSVPEPLTASLFGVGLAGAAALRRRKAKT